MRGALATGLALLVALCVSAGAGAAPSVRIGIADGNVLNGTAPGDREATLAAWRAAGVDDVRLFAQWDKVAPAPSLTVVPPGFEAPAAAGYDLSAIDADVDRVRRHGMTVTLVITGPGPVWASRDPSRGVGAWDPDPERFAAFAAAVARRVGDRVDRYVVWNEPNIKLWLQPQYRCRPAPGRPRGPGGPGSHDGDGRPGAGDEGGEGTTCEAAAPHLYRGLARAGYAAVHGADRRARVAVGATSSLGSANRRSATSTTPPLRFLRAVACRDRRFRAVRTGPCRGFRPVVGEALAYHPHSTDRSPGAPDPAPNNARMADLPRLLSTIDRLTAVGGLRVRGARRLPLWLDEWGYQTTPPDPVDGFQSPAVAADYLQWGWSLASRNPRVELLTQYEWFDEPIVGDDTGRWQSGLYSADGRPKPAARAFPHPVFGWRTRGTGHLWGQVRRTAGPTTVSVQRRRDGRFVTVARVRTDRFGVFETRVPASARSRWRFAYRDPSTGATATSPITRLRATGGAG